MLSIGAPLTIMVLLPLWGAWELNQLFYRILASIRIWVSLDKYFGLAPMMLLAQLRYWFIDQGKKDEFWADKI